MAEKEQAIVAGWLFAGRAKTCNVKFFRGSRDMITVEEFWAEFHSAMMQKKLDAAKVSTEPPATKRKTIDVREFILSQLETWCVSDG